MNIAKYESVAHYIIYAARNAPEHKKIGYTKLNKMLYYSDFLSYFKYKKPITGDSYIRKQHGPVPEKIEMIVGNLKKNGKIIEIPQIFESGHQRKKLLPMSEPDLENIDKTALPIIHEMIESLIDFSAQEISQFSHDIVWKSFKMGEKIPYYMSYIVFGCCDVNDSDMLWAHDVFKRSSRAA